MGIGGAIRSVRHLARNGRAVRQGTRPGRIFFAAELGRFLKVDERWLEKAAGEYRRHAAAWRRLCTLRSPSRDSDGYAKTLDVAEGFALWALVKHLRPRVVVELGTQYGISARLWKEALSLYVPSHELILCDLEDARRFIGNDECTFLKGDARETLSRVYATRHVDILFNDAHPYELIRWSAEEALRRGVQTFAFHDVGCAHPRGSFKAHAHQVPAAQRTSHDGQFGECGHWERHVIADIFDSRALSADAVAGEACQIQFFDSLFGFGVVRVAGAKA